MESAGLRSMCAGTKHGKRRRIEATYDNDAYEEAERQIERGNKVMSDDDYDDFERYSIRAEDAVRAGMAREGRLPPRRPKRNPNIFSFSGHEALHDVARANVSIKIESDPVNQVTETLHHTTTHSQTPVTPDHGVSNPQMSARDFAQKWQHHYAGELTEFLEKRHFEWKGMSVFFSVHVSRLTRLVGPRGHAKVWDSFCLVCYTDDEKPDLKHCNTCSRVYHKECLNIPTTQELERTWHCPLCVKRLWDKVPPTKVNHASSTLELEGRRMALCRNYTTNANFCQWIEYHDDGTLESDHVLIMAIGKASFAKYLDLDSTFDQPVEDSIYGPVTGPRYHDQGSPTPLAQQDQEAASNLDQWLATEATRPADCDG